ncbi:type I DNA topoisomerase [Ferrovum sp.]|uniref:type I DNA topoisomerase n=1 Tax=Ferrovum sp. TaxID=2609467 RepID=UPI002625F0B1|nr:type I DNA topoisomerase [Ferrovum sp.]
MSKKLLIVESPSKAKTLKKYLGPDFEILASYGHVRDLIPKSGAVDPNTNFSMKYQLVERNKKHVDAIMRAVKSADHVFLATDPDREGEAIAWHLVEILRPLLEGKPFERVVFYEITQNAIRDAVAHPRALSLPLVNAQQARRALDYLVGFNLSPLLWKKIRRGLSAGRVQSPALRLIVEREQQITAFRQEEYWTLHLESLKEAQPFQARLVQWAGEKLQTLSITSEDQQRAWLDSLKDQPAQVRTVERKQRQRHPAAPFTTSTLQQESVRKLGFTTDRTMKMAQQLYEGIDIGSGAVGLISYMRTDSVQLSQEALTDIRDHIQANFSAEFLPGKPVFYANKTKNAQEAHEAIRPTSIARTPESMREHLAPDQFRLYEMIWKRTVASQMTSAQFDTVSVDISVGPQALFRATGQTMTFAGFIVVYREDVDEAPTAHTEGDESDRRLPPLVEGEMLPVERLWGEQHHTQPPPRYTEASLVKALEEFGIGRPSTYASIISTLIQREYVTLDKKRFMPTDVGEVVNRFLTEHFSRYVDYDFTARLEDQLDQISEGRLEWIPVLDQFWKDFSAQLEEKSSVSRAEITQELLEEVCPKCGKPLTVRLGKRGKFVGCSGYPDCDFTRNREGTPTVEAPTPVGMDPESQLPIVLMSGPYGPYVQLGESGEAGKKPKRVSLPKGLLPAQVTPDIALKLIQLPRTLGIHPVTEKPVIVNIGRFGPYVQNETNFRSIPKTDSLFDITLERATALLAEPKSPTRAAASGGLLRALGEHPKDHQPIELFTGKYGPYVKHGKLNVTVPADMAIDQLSLDDALDLIAAKLANAPDAPEKPPVNGNLLSFTPKEPNRRSKAPPGNKKPRSPSASQGPANPRSVRTRKSSPRKTPA